MKNIVVILFTLFYSELFAQNFNVKGIVVTKGTNLPLNGANIRIQELGIGVVTDNEGYFNLALPVGIYKIDVSFVGYTSYSHVINVNEDLFIRIELINNDIELKEVVVTNKKINQNIENPNAGALKLTMQDIKKIPVFMGEYDPVKALRLTPGVQAGGEGNAGIFIRGGDPGQNLVMLEDLPIYNASHLIGLYSVFNPSVIKSVTLYKGSFSSAYGGRASSLMKVALAEGIPDKIDVDGGIGLLSSRLSIKMPLFNSKSSLMIGGRLTYLDVYKPVSELLDLKNLDLHSNSFGFNDFNMKFEYQISSKNRIVINAYTGVDKYKLLESPIGLKNNMFWGNRAASIRWSHSFNPDFSWSNSIGFTSYFFSLDASFQKYAIDLYSDIKDVFYRSDTYITKNKHFFQIGLESTLHSLMPGDVGIRIDNSNYDNNLHFKSGEVALFFNDVYKANSKLSFILGLRTSAYIHLGNYNRYLKDNLGLVYDTISYGNNESVKKYCTVEPRFSVVFKQSDIASLKLSLSRNYQFIHLISVGTVSLPTDIWFPSTRLVRPEFTDQVSIGYFRNFSENNFESSMEIYFRRMGNVIEFKNSLITPFKYNEFEESITQGVGYSYGSEWYIRKARGRFTGWTSYTLSWSVRKFDDINQGKMYFGKYDRRHDLALSLQYELSKRWSISAVFIYSTGNAMTLPSGRYMIQGKIVNDYTAVNSFRMPVYHRLDLSATYSRKVKDKYVISWNFSIYNAYNRPNPYYIYFEAKGNLNDYYLSVKAKRVTLFPMLPSISWSFKF